MKLKKIIGFVLVLVIGLVGVSILSKQPETVVDIPDDDGQETPEPSETPDTEPENNEPETITPTDTIVIPERGYLLGILPIPYDEQDFNEAYQLASESCELVPVWGRPSPYWEKADDLEGQWGQIFVEQYTRGNGLAPLLHFSFIGENYTVSSPEGTEYTLSSPEWRLEYKESVIESVRVCRPVYISLGNEVNRWYEVHGMDGDNGFRQWISLYEEIYDEVKTLSPETKVFCTFSREIVNENREADLSILEDFNPDKIDVLVLTSYPYSLKGVNTPEDIPTDYYTSIAEYLPGKPIGFSEIAWTSMETFGGEQAQADFINGLSELTTGLDLEFIMWPWLSDLTEGDTTGLIKRDGTEKLGYLAWCSL